jgi:hypothetical protein
MELVTMILNEISQMQANVACFVSYVESRPKNKKTSVKGVFCRGTKGREDGERLMGE